MSTAENIKKLLLVSNYIGYGLPTKQILDETIRKRGYLKTADHKRTPISNNILIEELVGSSGVICIEDVIDAFWNCKKNYAAYEAVRQVLWPIQLAPLKDSIAEASITAEATGRSYKKTKTASKKGGYLGMMGAAVNDYVARLIWHTLLIKN